MPCYEITQKSEEASGPYMGKQVGVLFKVVVTGTTGPNRTVGYLIVPADLSLTNGQIWIFSFYLKRNLRNRQIAFQIKAKYPYMEIFSSKIGQRPGPPIEPIGISPLGLWSRFWLWIVPPLLHHIWLHVIFCHFEYFTSDHTPFVQQIEIDKLYYNKIYVNKYFVVYYL